MAGDVAFDVVDMVGDVASVAEDVVAIVADVAIVAGVADVADVAIVVGIVGVVVVIAVSVAATEVVARTVGMLGATIGLQAVNDIMAAKPISQTSSFFIGFPPLMSLRWTTCGWLSNMRWMKLA